MRYVQPIKRLNLEGAGAHGLDDAFSNARLKLRLEGSHDGPHQEQATAAIMVVGQDDEVLLTAVSAPCGCPMAWSACPKAHAVSLGACVFRGKHAEP